MFKKTFNSWLIKNNASLLKYFEILSQERRKYRQRQFRKTSAFWIEWREFVAKYHAESKKALAIAEAAKPNGGARPPKKNKGKKTWPKLSKEEWKKKQERKKNRG